MRDDRCFICKFLQVDRTASNLDAIFDSAGNERSIGLCYSHSVELFKSGQHKFLGRYRDVFAGNFGFEADFDLVRTFKQSRKEIPWY
jgi:hypothetical protein